MTIELYALLAACIVYASLPLAHNYPRMRAGGAAWALGNRDEPPTTAPWVDRVERAYRNYLEWLPVFAILILVAHVTHVHTTATVVAAVAYPVVRVVYSIAYGLGSRARSPLWYVSSACLIALLVEILRSPS